MKLINTEDNQEIKKVNLHEGHRKRLRRQLEETDFVNADEYLVLEYILTIPIMRRDTNEIAHRLINTFGSLANVLDSSVSDLTTIGGVSPTVAHFLHCIPFVFRNYKLSKANAKPVITCAKDIFTYLGEAVYHLPKEEFYMICLDNASKVITKKLITQGDSTQVAISIKECAEYAMKVNASKVIMLHNHPAGSPEPSRADLETTKRMLFTFELSGIELYDHVIVNYEQNYYSFAREGVLDKYRKDCKKLLEV